jgi:hypothetical protein
VFHAKALCGGAFAALVTLEAGPLNAGDACRAQSATSLPVRRARRCGPPTVQSGLRATYYHFLCAVARTVAACHFVLLGFVARTAAWAAPHSPLSLRPPAV